MLKNIPDSFTFCLSPKSALNFIVSVIIAALCSLENLIESVFRPDPKQYLKIYDKDLFLGILNTNPKNI